MKSDIFLGIKRQKNEIAITNHTIRFFEIKIEELSKIDQSPDVVQEIARCNSMLTLFGIVKKRQQNEYEQAQSQLSEIIKEAKDIEMVIFNLRFIENKRISEIAGELNYSVDHIKRICVRLNRKMDDAVKHATFMPPIEQPVSG